MPFGAVIDWRNATANLFTVSEELQLKKNKKKAMLSSSKRGVTIVNPVETQQGHDRTNIAMSIKTAIFYSRWVLPMRKHRLFRAWRVNGNRLINL